MGCGAHGFLHLLLDYYSYDYCYYYYCVRHQFNSFLMSGVILLRMWALISELVEVRSIHYCGLLGARCAALYDSRTGARLGMLYDYSLT